VGITLEQNNHLELLVHILAGGNPALGSIITNS
jgi:hypothetical protein